MFFIVPDVVATLTALFCPRAAARQVTLTLAGSLCAGALMFGWASQAPTTARGAVLSVPFVRQAMSEKVRADYVEEGARGLLRGPFSGVPFKLYAIEAPGRLGMGEFLAWGGAGRLTRFAGGVIVAAMIGRLARGAIRRRPGIAVAAWAVFWTLLYARYWTTV